MGQYGAFNPSYRGLGLVLISPEMQAAMLAKAKKAKDYAEAISPVGPPDDPHRDEYKASWETESGVQRRTTSRAYGRLTNTADYAVDVEFGNSHQDGQYVVTRSIDAMKE